MKDFTLYPEAFELKQLGFDEPCLKFYATEKLVIGLDTDNGDTNSKLSQYNPLFISAPTYTQAFRWFREKYKLKCCIIPLVCGRGYSDLYESRIHQEKHSVSIIGNYKIYEEAELACLKELIEIVKGGNK